MLIDKFPFQNRLSLLQKYTKCTLNLRSFGFSSADPSREVNSDKFLRGKFVPRSFDLFFFKTTTEYFLQIPLLICTFYRCILLTGEEIC